MMRYYLICIFLCGGYLTDPAWGGNGFEKADSLFRAGKFYPASVEYERAAFLAGDNTLRTLALLKKAECFKQTSQYTEAEKITDRILLSNLSDTLLAESHYQRALCSYLSGNFTGAENHLIQMHAFIKDSSLTQFSLPLYSLVLNELKRWDEAKGKIIASIDRSKISPPEKDSLKRSITQLYMPANYPHLKDVLKAQKMSAFLPGLGQLYAGYFWEGAASAFLNVASVTLMGYWIYNELYFTGIVTGSGIFAKFYTGGTNRLEYLVEKRNYKVLRAYNDRLKPAILTGLRK